MTPSKSKTKGKGEGDNVSKPKKLSKHELNTDPSLHPLGSQHNPLQGPPPADFRGPEVNYTPSSEAIRNGRAAPLGTLSNPIVGPPVGVSPGVQNPGAIPGEGSTSTFVRVTEEDEVAQIQATDGKDNDPNVTKKPTEAPATLITTGEGGEVTKRTIQPEPGKSSLETAQQQAGIENGAQVRKDEADKATEAKKAQQQAQADQGGEKKGNPENAGKDPRPGNKKS